ncbi:MAG: LysR family transcriptional regulator [Betaproteobacteria bacterium]|nr:LysR family transcriptional regulator [Betaproteobacteria bacterium]
MKHQIAASKLRILFGEDIAIGPGKADLLEAIRDTGSISSAGRKLGMSYKRAWNLADTMNRCFREPLIDTATGGGGGGGAHLTRFGEAVLTSYRRMEIRTDAAIREDLAEFAALLADAPRG